MELCPSMLRITEKREGTLWGSGSRIKQSVHGLYVTRAIIQTQRSYLCNYRIQLLLFTSLNLFSQRNSLNVWFSVIVILKYCYFDPEAEKLSKRKACTQKTTWKKLFPTVMLFIF